MGWKIEIKNLNFFQTKTLRFNEKLHKNWFSNDFPQYLVTTCSSLPSANSRRNHFEMLNRVPMYLDQSWRSHFIVFTLQSEFFFKITRLETQISLVGLISIRLIGSVNDLAVNIANVSQSLHQCYYRSVCMPKLFSMCCRIKLQWRPYFKQIAVLGRNFRNLSERNALLRRNSR